MVQFIEWGQLGKVCNDSKQDCLHYISDESIEVNPTHCLVEPAAQLSPPLWALTVSGPDCDKGAIAYVAGTRGSAIGRSRAIDATPPGPDIGACV